jgi:hypothetical protein
VSYCGEIVTRAAAGPPCPGCGGWVGSDGAGRTVAGTPSSGYLQLRSGGWGRSASGGVRDLLSVGNLFPRVRVCELGGQIILLCLHPGLGPEILPNCDIAWRGRHCVGIRMVPEAAIIIADR